MSYYLAGMFLIPLLEWLDRLHERHAVRLELWDGIPDKAVVIGIFVNACSNGIRRDLRFVRIKLPIWSWGPQFPFMSYGFVQHSLFWIEGDREYFGWQLQPPLEG